MAHTRAFSTLRRLLLLARDARARGIPVAEHLEERRARATLHRRRFLGMAALAAPAVAGLPGCGAKKSDDEVAIVGGGAAGLTCAFRLAQAGVPARVYEWQSRTGGRMTTDREVFAGQSQLSE